MEFRLLTTGSRDQRVEALLLSASLYKPRSKDSGRRILRIETSSSLADPTASVGHLRFELVLADLRVPDLAKRARVPMKAARVASCPRSPRNYFVALECLEDPMDSHAITWQLALETAARAQVHWTSLVDWIDVRDPRAPEVVETLPNGSFRPNCYAKIAARLPQRPRRRTTTSVPHHHDASSDEISFASL